MVQCFLHLGKRFGVLASERREDVACLMHMYISKPGVLRIALEVLGKAM